MFRTSIEDLDKLLLLEYLWEAAYKRGEHRPESFDHAAHAASLASNPNYLRDLDCVQGRSIQCDISGDTVDPTAYNQLYGRYAFDDVVREGDGAAAGEGKRCVVEQPVK
ncbi:hypothetical protein BJY04DRAFT_213735 [Aspergillus karnatakaensis]|uniref:uncharacterized protein n=1 Tax=Aspergillus karnatakaensis TaxID=1810916 RepID=UPI003CCD6ABA